MESPNVPLDLSDFALADAQFLPTLEEMNEAAVIPKPIIAQTKPTKRDWGKIADGISSVGIAWLTLIFNPFSLVNFRGLLVLAISLTLFGSWRIYRGLRPQTSMLSVDNAGITIRMQKHKKQRLQWHEISWWQILDFSDASLPSNSYYMYLFHCNDDHPGSGWNQPASIRYRWEEPTGAHLRKVGITGDRHITFQQQIRLARALIALHLGPPRGEPLESFASNEVHDASHRA